MRSFKREPKQAPQKIIIIGAGEVGFHIAQRLSQENKEVVVVDKSPNALKRLAEHMDVQTIEGSGSSPMILDQAGVEGADIFLAVTDSDEINIIACLFANILSPKSRKLARIRNEEYTLYRDILSKDILNIGMVINPEVEVVKSIDRLISMPGIVEFSEFGQGKIKMLALRLDSERLDGVCMPRIRDVVGHQDFIVAAIVRNERLIIPTGADCLMRGDLVYLVCSGKDLSKTLKAFGREVSPVRDVLIVGGGNIGLRAATLFERKGYHTKLVEMDEERCDFLAGKLNKVVVLKGDGTDKDFLQEENVGDMDVVVSLTGDEETNILTSLLAKSMGARQTITRINKFAYIPLVTAIGMEHSVSPRLSAINSVLHNVRKGNILSSVSIKGEEAEAMEAMAEENSNIVGKPLKELSFPKGAIILCLMRAEEVIIPTGDTVIEPGDRIIILSSRQNISRVEQALTMKLEYF